MDRKSNDTGGSKNILFNKYEIGKLLRQGNFTKVYHRRNLSTNDIVAIKVIKKEKLQKDKLVKQIKHEVSVMRLVRHPHIDFNRDDYGGSVNVSDSEDGNSSSNHSGELVGAKPAHPSYNDLSNLFKTRKWSSLMFISKHLTSVMAKLEAVAKKMNFRVTRKKSFTVRM